MRGISRYTHFFILNRVCWGNHKILTPIDLLKKIDRVSARVFGKKIKKVYTYKYLAQWPSKGMSQKIKHRTVHAATEIK